MKRLSLILLLQYYYNVVSVLPANGIYLLKYTSVNDRSRKDPSGKLLYQTK